ncbi:MAG: DUF2339 domain-containing protein [Leptospira sp.]|nr:DUF2339 domain-containing protein [Leptospira sp.]
MADKPLSQKQILARIESIETELIQLKAEVNRWQKSSAKVESQAISPSSQPTDQVVKPEFASKTQSAFSILKWESFLGENLFIKLGLLTMLLGAIWFINLAFEQYWINESVRIWMGLTLGSAIVYLGLRLIKDWPLIGPSLAGTGVSLIFVSYFLGYFLYDLYNIQTTFIGLSLLSLFTISFSYLIRNEVVFGFGILGAFLVPALLSTGENSYQFLFLYLLVWNLLFLMISKVTQWRITPLLLLAGNHLMFGGWAVEKLENSSWEIPLLFQSGIFLIFLYREHVLVPRISKSDQTFSLVTVSATLLFGFSQCYYISTVFFPLFTNALLVTMVLVYYSFLYRTFTKVKESESAIHDLFIGGVGLIGMVFVLATLVIGFEGRMLSLGTFAFAILLGFLGTKLRQSPIYFFSYLFWIYGLLNLIYVQFVLSDTNWIFLNSNFVLYVFASALLFQLGRMGNDLEFSKLFLGTAFPVLLLGTFGEVSGHVSDEFIILGYTSVLGFYGFTFTVFSFIKSNQQIRKIGLFCLGIVICKLYLYDFWNMGMIARILAGFGLGAALVITGIIYNRQNKNKIQNKDQT